MNAVEEETDIKKSRRFILWIIIAGVVCLWTASFLSPELAIRRYLLMHLHPVVSMTATIKDTNRHDPVYGDLYDIRGYQDRQTGGELGFFYLKKRLGIWYVASAGSGP